MVEMLARQSAALAEEMPAGGSPLRRASTGRGCPLPTGRRRTLLDCGMRDTVPVSRRLPLHDLSYPAECLCRIPGRRRAVPDGEAARADSTVGRRIVAVRIGLIRPGGSPLRLCAANDYQLGLEGCARSEQRQLRPADCVRTAGNDGGLGTGVGVGDGR